MNIESLGSELGIYAGTLLVCFIGGLVPVVNAELWLTAVTLLATSPAPLPVVVVLAATGQMLAKCLLFMSARGVLDLPRGRLRARVERSRATLQRWRHRPVLLLFASASVGVPPFYVVTLLAGGLRFSFRTFALVGMCGRLARFAVVVGLVWAGGG